MYLYPARLPALSSSYLVLASRICVCSPALVFCSPAVCVRESLLACSRLLLAAVCERESARLLSSSARLLCVRESARLLSSSSWRRGRAATTRVTPPPAPPPHARPARTRRRGFRSFVTEQPPYCSSYCALLRLIPSQIFHHEQPPYCSLLRLIEPHCGTLRLIAPCCRASAASSPTPARFAPSESRRPAGTRRPAPAPAGHIRRAWPAPEARGGGCPERRPRSGTGHWAAAPRARVGVAGRRRPVIGAPRVGGFEGGSGLRGDTDSDIIRVTLDVTRVVRVTLDATRDDSDVIRGDSDDLHLCLRGRSWGEVAPAVPCRAPRVPFRLPPVGQRKDTDTTSSRCRGYLAGHSL